MQRWSMCKQVQMSSEFRWECGFPWSFSYWWLWAYQLGQRGPNPAWYCKSGTNSKPLSHLSMPLYIFLGECAKLDLIWSEAGITDSIQQLCKLLSWLYPISLSLSQMLGRQTEDTMSKNPCGFNLAYSLMAPHPNRITDGNLIWASEVRKLQTTKISLIKFNSSEESEHFTWELYQNRRPKTKVVSLKSTLTVLSPEVANIFSFRKRKIKQTQSTFSSKLFAL